jgi:hypothetical protein
MFTESLLSICKQEYKVVDLPEPVGPDVKIIPLGKEIPLVIKS